MCHAAATTAVAVVAGAPFLFRRMDDDDAADDVVPFASQDGAGAVGSYTASLRIPSVRVRSRILLSLALRRERARAPG